MQLASLANLLKLTTLIDALKYYNNDQKHRNACFDPVITPHVITCAHNVSEKKFKLHLQINSIPESFNSISLQHFDHRLPRFFARFFIPISSMVSPFLLEMQLLIAYAEMQQLSYGSSPDSSPIRFFKFESLFPALETSPRQIRRRFQIRQGFKLWTFTFKASHLLQFFFFYWDLRESNIIL